MKRSYAEAARPTRQYAATTGRDNRAARSVCITEEPPVTRHNCDLTDAMRSQGRHLSYAAVVSPARICSPVDQPTQVTRHPCAGSSKPLSRNKLTVEAVAPKTQPGQQQANKFLRRSRIPVKMTAKRQSSAVPPQSTNHGLHKRSPAATIAVAATTDSSIPSLAIPSLVRRPLFVMSRGERIYQMSLKINERLSTANSHTPQPPSSLCKPTLGPARGRSGIARKRSQLGYTQQTLNKRTRSDSMPARDAKVAPSDHPGLFADAQSAEVESPPRDISADRIATLCVSPPKNDSPALRQRTPDPYEFCEDEVTYVQPTGSASTVHTSGAVMDRLSLRLERPVRIVCPSSQLMRTRDLPICQPSTARKDSEASTPEVDSLLPIADAASSASTLPLATNSPDSSNLPHDQSDDENPTLTAYSSSPAAASTVSSAAVSQSLLRRAASMQRMKDNHTLRAGCRSGCRHKCTANFTDLMRHKLNSDFWDMDNYHQRCFIVHSIKRMSVARRRGEGESRRANSFAYCFSDADGEKLVCKTFFLATLGFARNNDSMIMDSLHSAPIGGILPTPNQRGRAPSNAKIDRGLIRAHINSFNPSVSHYRREHAPNRLYLSSDVTVHFMHTDFIAKFDLQCSYEVYRSVVKEMKISFTKLGHEECEVCESFDLHGQTHNRDNLAVDCGTCQMWLRHIERSTQARQQYRADRAMAGDVNLTVVSADLQKVIMLPRIDQFKAALFTRRLVAFNESFIPVGMQQQHLRPFAAVWHEGISGRKREDIASTFHQFLLRNADKQKVVIWLDNCSAQNKNWGLLSFLVYIINSDAVQTDTIELKYFEPGHTFMSADSFHHQVEKSMKKAGKVYDFCQFQHCVETAVVGNADVVYMQPSDFHDWPDVSSTYKLNRLTDRPYLSDIVYIKAERGRKTIDYKTAFDGNATTLDFLNTKVLKNGMSKAPCHLHPRGVPQDKKADILTSLSSLIPEERIAFWQELPVANVCDLTTEQDID